MVKFEPENHKYTSVDTKDAIEWVSVTSVLKHFKEPFDSERIANKSGSNQKSKWYGMTSEEIQNAWKGEADRACDLGNWYHDQRESDVLECETLDKYGVTLPVIKPMVDGDNIKTAPFQKLSEGIYPEHLCYLRSAGICGQSDLVEVVNGYVHITDYKTNKEIKKQSYVNWEGISKKMLPPLSHLDDCNFNHYALQLSIYMFIILKHNPKLKAGNIVISHVTFEEAGRDKYDYPITLLSDDGNPVIKQIIRYDMPYLKNEVITILKQFKPKKLT